MASGPPGARFATGTSSSAQPELNVPRMPMTEVVRVYALAFAVHVAEFQEPSWAVESSHFWNWSVYLPALKLCCSRTSWIASLIWSVCSLEEPWSGKSDTIVNCPLPIGSEHVALEPAAPASAPPPPPPPLLPPPPPHPAAAPTERTSAVATSVRPLTDFIKRPPFVGPAP